MGHSYVGAPSIISRLDTLLIVVSANRLQPFEAISSCLAIVTLAHEGCMKLPAN